MNTSILQQLQQRRAQQQKTLLDLEHLTGIKASVICNAMNGKRDSRLSTLEALAGALDSTLVAVPKHLVPEVMRLLSGKAIGPDDVLPAARRLLGRRLCASSSIQAMRKSGRKACMRGSEAGGGTHHALRGHRALARCIERDGSRAGSAQ